MSEIKNIIFDFGGVLYDIRYENIADTFRSYGIQNFESHYTKAAQSSFIDDFEIGKITVPEFRNCIRTLAGKPLNNEQIDKAWNAILIDMPIHRFEFLCSLKEKYNLYLFSNTNQLNYDLFYRQLKTKFGADLFAECFKKAYFSFLIGKKKPFPDAFRYVIEDAGIDPKETLFIDDSPQHIEGAKQAGLNAFHLKDSTDITELFDANWNLVEIINKNI